MLVFGVVGFPDIDADDAFLEYLGHVRQQFLKTVGGVHFVKVGGIITLRQFMEQFRKFLVYLLAFGNIFEILFSEFGRLIHFLLFSVHFGEQVLVHIEGDLRLGEFLPDTSGCQRCGTASSNLRCSGSSRRR